jgi:outer membrane protein TolC
LNAILLTVLLGTTPIRLDEVRALSRENIAQRIAELNAALAHDQKTGSISAVLPQINFSAGVARTYYSAAQTLIGPFKDPAFPDTDPHYRQDVVPQIAYTSNAYTSSTSLSQLLFDGGKWWNQIDQAGASEEAAKGQSIEQRFASEFEGVRRFYLLVLAQKTLDVLNANEKRSAHQLEVADALHGAARASKSDVVQAQINLGNDQIVTVTQASSIASAQSDLATWIAHQGAEELVAVEPPELQAEALPVPTLERSLQMARDNRPLLKALAQQLRAAELAISVARGGYWPSLQGQLTYSRMGNTVDPFFSNLRLNNALTMQVALRWNLFSGFATTAQVRTALSNRRIAQLNLEQSTHDVEADVRRNLRSLESNLKATNFARINLEAAKYGLTLAHDRFQAGAGSTLEVRDAQLKLAQAELTLIQNRISVEVARANLERSMGAYLSAGS